ncbi:hypothetical protein CRYUN_Cryun33cG0036900 [Craigia yunnanensis]
MVEVSRKQFSMLLNLALVAMMDSTGNVQQLLPPFPFLPTPGLVPLRPGEVQKRWSSFSSIQGCIIEVYTSFFRGQTGIIGPACC